MLLEIRKRLTWLDMDEQRIMSPLLPGSNPGQPTANLPGLLAHQQEGEAVTLEKTEKARGRQPGETGNGQRCGGNTLRDMQERR